MSVLKQSGVYFYVGQFPLVQFQTDLVSDLVYSEFHGFSVAEIFMSQKMSFRSAVAVLEIFSDVDFNLLLFQ